MVTLWKKRTQEEPVGQIDPAALVQEKLSADTEIRPFPAAVTRLLAAMRDENSTSATFAEIIECDAALALRLLRMANSPLHGFKTDVRSVAHATSVLGTRSLKMLAMSASAATLFADGSSAATTREELWRHSLGVGTVARELVKANSSVSPEDAFLAGIFHDVGKLFFLDVVPDEYESLSRSHFGADLIEQETSVFSATHDEIGLKFAHSWNLAENLKVAIGYHHRVADVPVHNELVEAVHLGDQLARAWGIGNDELGDDGLSEYARGRLESDAEFLAQVRERSEAAFVETQEMCG